MLYLLKEREQKLKSQVKKNNMKRQNYLQMISSITKPPRDIAENV